MPDAIATFRTYVVGPAGYPTSPAITRIELEDASWPDTLVRFDDPRYAQAWLLASRKRPQQWRLVYDGRPRSQLDTILAYYDSVGGMEGVFSFRHPVTAAGYRARFAEDLVKWQHRDKANIYTFDVLIEEVP